MSTKSEVRETIGDTIIWIVLSWITLGTTGAMFFVFASRHQNTLDIVANFVFGGLMFAVCIFITYIVIDHAVDHIKWLKERQKEEDDRISANNEAMQNHYKELVTNTDWGTSPHKREPVGRRVASWRMTRAW